MADGELSPGDGLLLKSFTDHPADTVKWSYKGPKKGYHLAVWLGIMIPDAEGPAGWGVDERLNALGWVFDPEKAKAGAATPPALTGGHGEAIEHAADFLDQYASFIRDDVKASDLERHPYLPAIECIVADLRALATEATGRGEGDFKAADDQAISRP